MKTTIDYSKSPAKSFDAVEDIKDYLGLDRWEKVSPEFAQIKDPEQFSAWAGFAGIEGFPVKAWYELYHGEGSWNRAWDVKESAQ
jgi:hypothetical protein